MAGHQWKSDYSVWVVVSEDFGISLHETEGSARSWAEGRPGSLVRTMQMHHETDEDWKPLVPRPAWAERLRGLWKASGND